MNISVNTQNSTWKKAILLSGIVFQVIFLIEVVLFSDIVIVDPSAHNITYDNWKWVVLEWDPPEYWALHSSVLTSTVMVINVAFQLIFGIELTYIFIKIERFPFNRMKFLLSIVFLIIVDVAIRVYIKYNVNFYRLYMYSVYNELIGIYIIYCGKRHKLCRH